MKIPQLGGMRVVHSFKVGVIRESRTLGGGIKKSKYHGTSQFAPCTSCVPLVRDETKNSSLRSVSFYPG